MLCQIAIDVERTKLTALQSISVLTVMWPVFRLGSTIDPSA